MPTFFYKAIAPAGDTITGDMDAVDRKQVIQKLTAQDIKPLTITLLDQTGNKNKDHAPHTLKGGRWYKNFRPTFRIQSKRKLALNFLQKLRELLASGMPLGDAVRLMSQRLNDPYIKVLCDKIWRNLSEGYTLSKSMAEMPDVFNESSVHLVEAGEATGNLTPILEKIVTHMEETTELRNRILNSLAYPLFICVIAFAVVSFFLFFLLPKIRSMLLTLGGEIQLFAKILIIGSDIALKSAPLVIIVFAILLIALLQWRKKPVGRKKTDIWLLRMPFIGKIFYYSEIFQSSSLMATLMESGINTTESLRLSEKTFTNTHLKAKFGESRQQIQQGASVAIAFNRTQFMPDLALDILTVGENTGNLVNSLREITKIYRRELTRYLQILTAVISSAALIFAFILVTIIALSIIFSVFQVSNSLSV